eukprot:2235725-Prymnesium_polylepis.1
MRRKPFVTFSVSGASHNADRDPRDGFAKVLDLIRTSSQGFAGFATHSQRSAMDSRIRDRFSDSRRIRGFADAFAK